MAKKPADVAQAEGVARPLGRPLRLGSGQMKRVERCCSGASVGPRKRQFIETSVHVTPEGARILAEEVEGCW